ncbi:hypothetical protein [Acetobacter fallax]|uniref:Transposase n=1 Tax=Acetobacter fallax TaxID=1737473 RepID=A0ABX0KCJ1_9PROT|nr:hypothetical protein [Acetobacter fallax]NHO34162.1 hypothetical protein [Acetobacter fallax]NHO37711.1 hypothetical protein [Acetobacter fallax]
MTALTEGAVFLIFHTANVVLSPLRMIERIRHYCMGERSLDDRFPEYGRNRVSRVTSTGKGIDGSLPPSLNQAFPLSGAPSKKARNRHL